MRQRLGGNHQGFHRHHDAGLAQLPSGEPPRSS